MVPFESQESSKKNTFIASIKFMINKKDAIGVLSCKQRILNYYYKNETINVAPRIKTGSNDLLTIT